MVQNANNDTTSINIQSSDIPTNSHNLILGLSALSFFTGLTGSALYARRKSNKFLLIIYIVFLINFAFDVEVFLEEF